MDGESLPFFVGCHCLATAGYLALRQVFGVGSRPEQYGHRFRFFVRLNTAVCHSCPFEHFHHTRL